MSRQRYKDAFIAVYEIQQASWVKGWTDGEIWIGFSVYFRYPSQRAIRIYRISLVSTAGGGEEEGILQHKVHDTHMPKMKSPVVRITVNVNSWSAILSDRVTKAEVTEDDVTCTCIYTEGLHTTGAAPRTIKPKNDSKC